MCVHRAFWMTSCPRGKEDPRQVLLTNLDIADRHGSRQQAFVVKNTVD